MPFDPDAYLKKKPEQTANPFISGGFDPDAYLKQEQKPFDPDAYLGAKPVAPTPTAPEEKGFISRNIDWAGDALRSGWESILSSVEGNRQAIADEFITKLEVKYGPGAVNAPPDKQQEYKEAVALAAKSQAERKSIAEKQQQRYALNPQREATQQFKAAITGFDEDKLSFLESASKAGGALLSNPVGVIADLGLESTPASVAMVASALLTRFGGGSNLLAAGAGGASSAVTEFGNEYAARRDKGIPHDKAWEDAATKSGVIGLLDAVSMNSAGKAAGVIVDALSGTKRIGKAGKEVLKETGKQAGLGAAGEAGGSLAIGEVPNPAAVMAEAVGEVFGAPLEAVGTYQRLGPKPEIKDDTPEAKALRDLDTLAEEEERAAEPRRPADLTQQEIANIERRLFAELGREPNEFEFEEAIDDYLDEQNAGRGVESGAGVAGIPSISEPEAAGVQDTTVTPTSESGRLDTTGGAAEVAGVGEGTQPAALSEENVVDRIYEASRTSEAGVELRTLFNELADEFDGQELLNRFDANVDNLSEEAQALYRDLKEQEKPGTLEKAPEIKGEPIVTWQGFPVLIAGEPFTDEYGNLQQRVKFPNALGSFEGEGSKYHYVSANELEQFGEYSTDPEIAKLQMRERSAFGDAKSLEDQQKELLTKAGRKPAKNSPARKKYDELEKRRVEAFSDWVESEDRLSKARKKAASKVEEVVTEETEAKTKEPTEVSKRVKKRYERLYKEKPPVPPTAKPTFALPESYAHGTDYLTSQKIIRGGRLIPDAGKRMYSYSQFGRKAVYLTARDGWWLDADKAVNGRAVPYEASVPFKLDPKANIREVNTPEELDAIAREIGEPDGTAMMRKLNVENLDYEQTARKVKGASFEDFVKQEVNRRREQLKKFDVPDADTVTDVDSWVAQQEKEFEDRPEFIRSKEDILSMLREQYDFLQNYENEYKDADEVTQKLIDAGIDGIYVGPDFGAVTDEEIAAFDKTYDETAAQMQGASPSEIYDAATAKYSEVNPTYFNRAFNPVATDQLALFRPELAVVDRARLAATRPEIKAKPALSVEEFKKKPGESEDAYVDRISRSTGSEMAPNIVEMLRNNDLNGALNAVANILPGFYSTLATRLSQLNLPTGVRIGDQRNLTRRGIDNVSSREQIRLFGYLRVATPDFFSKYFNQYDKEENLETVYKGLIELPKFVSPTKINPLRAEYETVLKSFNDFMPGLTAFGAYYPTFDQINLNDKIYGYGAGMRRESGLSYRTLLHESVHAATEILLNTPLTQRTPEQNAAIDELERLYRYALGKIKGDRYGFTSLSEFIAEVMTNRSFQNELKAIPYAPTKSNIFTRFVQAVMKLVGLDNVAGRAMVEAEKLFNAARPYRVESAGPRFIKGPLTSAWRSVEDLKNSKMPWIKALPHLANFFWNIATTPVRIRMLGALELRHLSDLSKVKFPQVGGAVRIIEKMVAHRGQIMTEAAGIAKDWMTAQKGSLAQSQLLGRLMLEATITKTEIDPKNTAINPVTKKPYYDANKVPSKVKDAWNTLDPKFQDIYRRVRDFYRKQLENAIEQMKANANRIVDTEKRQKLLAAIDKDFAEDKLVYPYFPLKRFGPYWFEVKKGADTGSYREFYEFEWQAQREWNYIKRKIQLLRGNKAQQKLAVEGMEKGNSFSQFQTRTSDVSNALKTVNELIDSLTDDLTNLQGQEEREDTIREVQATLREQINQLIYTLMPEQSLRRQMLKRKGIQGASSDMLRVFANSATRIAYQQARTKYATEFINNLNNARSYIKSLKTQQIVTPDQLERYRDVINEVEKRYKPIMGMEETDSAAKVAGIASDFITFMMMSAPMSAALNTVGFMQLAATQIGGRYGYIKATDRLFDNFTTYMGSTVERTIIPLLPTKQNANGTVISVRFPSAMESSKLKGLDKLAAEQLIKEEQVNVSQTYDMVGVGDRPSELTLSKYEAMKRAVFTPLHQIERFNREMTLLSTFQLEYEKLMSEPRRESTGIIIRDAQGNPEKYQNDATTPDGVPYSTEAYDIALSTAKDLTSITLGDTTRQMRPRYFMNALMALPLKFKRYMITAFYSMISNFNRGFVTPFSSAEIKQLRTVLELDKQPPDVIDQKIKEAEEFRSEISREGRKALLGTLTVTGLFTGAVGMPLYNLLMPTLVGMFTSDDDDEFFDFDNWFRNYMEVEFGGYLGGLLTQMGMNEKEAKKVGKKIGESLAVGPITTLTGGSFTERASLDFKSLLFRDMRYTPSTREQVLEAMVIALGPAAGLATNFADGVDLFKEGQYGRAFEKFLPAFLSKPLSAYRLATEGAQTKRGVEIISGDITASEIAMQSIGLTPYRISAAQKQSIEAVQKAQKIESRRNGIMNSLWMAHISNDDKAFDDALKDASDFSSRYPTLKIGYDEIMNSFKQRAKDKAIAEAIGAKVSKKMIPIVSPMLQHERE